MKLERVTIQGKELKATQKEPEDYKKGFFAGFVLGRERQLRADRKAMRDEILKAMK